jgi:hypothetical protein
VVAFEVWKDKNIYDVKKAVLHLFVAVSQEGAFAKTLSI